MNISSDPTKMDAVGKMLTLVHCRIKTHDGPVAGLRIRDISFGDAK